MRELIDKLAKLQESTSEINENSMQGLTEQQFMMVLEWFSAESGMPAKYAAADHLKEHMPGVTPWTWINSFRLYDIKRRK